MDRNDKGRDSDVIDLGAVASETKGPPFLPDIDEQGALGGGGLTDD